MKHKLHVSKFRREVSIGDVTTHIMNNTSIINDEESFTVEKLGKSGASFCSFKTSAASMEIYDEISKVWAPHYTAREFVDNNHNNNNRRFGTGNGTRFQAQRNGSHRERSDSGYRQHTNTPKTPNRLGNTNPPRDGYRGQH